MKLQRPGCAAQPWLSNGRANVVHSPGQAKVSPGTCRSPVGHELLPVASHPCCWTMKLLLACPMNVRHRSEGGAATTRAALHLHHVRARCAHHVRRRPLV